MRLPSRTDGTEAPKLPSECRHLIVVGANGSGKSRFATAVADTLGKRAFRTSALTALYGGVDDPAPNSIDGMYRVLIGRSPILRDDLHGQFDRLVALLLDEETRRMFAAKYGMGKAQGGPTPLERLATAWEDIFPGNKVLLAGGQMMFTTGAGVDTFRAPRLSDGEKAVIYHLGTALLAPPDSVMVVDAPEMFLHPASMGVVWEAVERMRPSGKLVYVTHNLEFASGHAQRPDTAVVWVKAYDAVGGTFTYELLPSQAALSDDIYAALMGSRKPVMFIEGDGVNSIDAKLYPLIFKDYNVRSLGSCNRVIEATRTFNDLSALHNLEAVGIVDRDRRNDYEVDYLRRRKVLVPEVAEIENLLMLEPVIKAVAMRHRKNPDKVFSRVRKSLIAMFSREKTRQALQHTRHRVKVDAEHMIDRRFSDISSLERHLAALVRSINPRGFYESTLAHFNRLIDGGDYAGILKVFNYKAMLGETNVAGLCGVDAVRKGAYLEAVLEILNGEDADAHALAAALRSAFNLPL